MKPTLAQKYDPKKAQFPLMVSPKLDGIRCLAEFTADGVKLWSRDEKPILSVEHVVLQLNQLALKLNIPVGTVLDGELYTQQMSFQVLNGTCRRQYFDERALPIKYYIFDVARHPSGVHMQDFPKRYDHLRDLAVQSCHQVRNTFGIETDVQTWLGHLHPWLNMYLSENVAVLTHNEALKDHDLQLLERDFVAAGLEGAMARTRVFDKKLKVWRDCGYETEESGHTRRTWGLQKVKSFDDAEFKIVGIFEEHDQYGAPKGRAAGFVMENNDGSGKTFQCSGLTDRMKVEVWDDPNAYVGQLATVKFFGRSDDGIPRHPNYKALRPASEVVPAA